MFTHNAKFCSVVHSFFRLVSSVKEIDNFARLLSTNEQELDACRRRKEESQRILTLISHCLSCISNVGGQQKSGMSARDEKDVSDLERPIDLLSIHFPFTSDRVSFSISSFAVF